MTTIGAVDTAIATLKQQLALDLPETMRQQVQQMLSTLMDQQVSWQVGDGLHERCEDRRVHRNGYLIRKLVTQLGCLDVRIPREGEGSLFSSFLESHCRFHSSLAQIVMEAYTQGISTRKINDLADALGITQLSISAVSHMLADLEEGVKTLCSRDLPVCPYVFVDAHYERDRKPGRIISNAVLVAVGVTTEGHREILGNDVVPSEEEGTWEAFLKGLTGRGQGVRLVVSDANGGLRRALQRYFLESSRQGCSIHLGRILATAVSHRHRAEVLGLLKIVVTSPDLATARESLKTTLEILHRRHPKAAAILESAGEDFLAFMPFPEVNKRKPHRTHHVDRLSRELKRQTRVVSIFPSVQNLLNLTGAILERFYLMWGGERYISSERMVMFLDPLAEVRDALRVPDAA